MATFVGENVEQNQNTQDFWNCALSKPVTCTLAVFPSWDQTEILRTARTTLAASVQCLSQQQQLTSEYSVLNRLIYMKNGQLRREKSFQGLKQIRSCLKKLFTYGLEKVLKEFHSDFENAILEEGIRVHLPSRQMWEYLLTHFLGAAALLSNIASRCAAVFLHVHKHLTTGNLIPINMVFLSMLSRIWACCQALCLDLQSWYLGLIPVRDVLASTEFEWLRQGEALPTDLSVWLTEHGLNAGLQMRELDKGEAECNELAALMEMCQQKDKKESADEVADSTDKTDGFYEMLPVATDETPPFFLDEDFGDPVSISDVEIESREDSPTTGESTKALPMHASPGLGRKVLTAPTIRDLQLLLKRFDKKFPGCSTKKKRRKCATFLADLESRSQVLEMKGNHQRVQKMLARGRKKLLKFIKMSSQVKKLSGSQNARGMAEKAKEKKKNKKKVATAGDAVTNTSVSVGVPETNCNKKKKNAAVSYAVGAVAPLSGSKKKNKKCLNDSTATNGGPEKRTLKKNKKLMNDDINTDAVLPARKKLKKNKELVSDEVNTDAILPAKKKMKQNKKLLHEEVNTDAILPAKRKMKKNKKLLHEEVNTDAILAAKRKLKKNKELVNDNISTDLTLPAKRKLKKSKKSGNDDINTDVIPVKRKLKRDESSAKDSEDVDAFLAKRKLERDKSSVKDSEDVDAISAKRKLERDKSSVKDSEDVDAFSAKRKLERDKSSAKDSEDVDAFSAKRKLERDKSSVKDSEDVDAIPAKRKLKRSRSSVNDRENVDAIRGEENLKRAKSL